MDFHAAYAAGESALRKPPTTPRKLIGGASTSTSTFRNGCLAIPRNLKMPVPSFAASNMSPTPGPGHGCSYRRGQWPAPARRRSWHVMCINKHSALYSHAPSTDQQTVSRIAQRASLGETTMEQERVSPYPRND
jgi:hypothetical protein